MQSCSKSAPTPVGMTCDYAPYAYKKKATFKFKGLNQFNKLDSGTMVNEIIGDSTINNIQYANMVATITTSSGASQVTKGIVRCGGGVYQYITIYGTAMEMKMLKENPAAGEKWVSEPYQMSYMGMAYTVSQTFEIVSTTVNMTVQGKAYTNLVKVKLYQTADYGSGVVMNSGFGIYYWDKTSGLVIGKTYKLESDFLSESNEMSLQELISLI